MVWSQRLLYLQGSQSILTTPPTSKEKTKSLDIIISGHGGVIDTTPPIVHGRAGEEAGQQAEGGQDEPVRK